MHWRRATRVAALAAFAAGAAAVPAAAAPTAQVSPGEDAGATFGEVLDVQVINLEVVVTDGSGERVTDLGPEAFRLSVDGQEVPIEFFTEVRDGRAVARDETGPSGDAGPPRADAAEAVGASYLVFLDDEHSLDIHRDRVLDRLARALPTLRPEDRMAVASYDGERLQFLADWTTPGPELEASLEAARELEGWGIRRLLEARGFTFGDPTFDPPRVSTGPGDDTASVFQRNLRWQARERMGVKMVALAAALNRFDDAPGRKVLVLLAGDWPAIGALSPYGAGLDGPGFDHAFDLYRPVIETANLLGWTLYPVAVSSRPAAGGSGELVAGTVGSRSTALATASARHQARRSQDLGNGAARRIVADSNLRYLAAETGGRAILYGDRLQALERVTEDTRSYYWLGFHPSFQRDDARHRVEVEVVRPGVSVRSRKGFIDLAPETARFLAWLQETVRTVPAPVAP